MLLIENSNEGEVLIPIKLKIIEYLKQKKQEGVITVASVYLKTFNYTSNHIEINPDELYDPASLMKIPMLILYLSRAENNPYLLDKKIYFSKRIESLYEATIKNKTITEGKSYSIKDLLFYMIVYSDNEAFWLLAKNVNNNDFIQLCQDFDIPLKGDSLVREDNQMNFIATVNSVSRFFRVLYNATYLGRNFSCYALNLLVQSDYKDGILKGVDPKIKVAHKFGERQDGGVSQLHEFGIVYLKDRNYLLGVMTKGKDIKQLAEVISNISKITFEGIK